MPEAVLTYWQAQEDGALYGYSGQHTHGFWMRRWGEIDPARAAWLHDEDGLSPFTVSPLLGLGDTVRGRTAVRRDARALLRLTTLEDGVHGRLLEEWLAQLPDERRISGMVWRRVGEVRAGANRPWAGQASYAALRAAGQAGGRQWTLVFETGTAVDLGDDRYLPFPLPAAVVARWLRLWHCFADVPLPAGQGDDAEPFLARVAAGLLVSRYRLKTISFRLRLNRREVPQIGCVGEVTFDGRLLAEADRATVGALAAFAFYCGTGHHTTMGMGQTRLADVR